MILCDCVLYSEPPTELDDLAPMMDYSETEEQNNDTDQNMIQEDGHKQFKCDQCTKVFKKSSHLKQHKRSHNGQYIHPTLFCHQLFFMLSLLLCDKDLIMSPERVT